MGFSFTLLSDSDVESAIRELNSSSSPGISGIHPKVLKLIPSILIPVYTKLFNHCFELGKIPDEWNMAVVTPLFINKGCRTNPNNYQSIYILPFFAKIFEKIVAKQITLYFENKNIFTEHQHGFRKGFSCETALHELISDLNLARNKKLISVLLFIDFRKAFNTVDSDLK